VSLITFLLKFRFDIFFKNYTDEILFTIEVHGSMNDDELRTFQSLNNMVRGLKRPLEIQKPYCMFEVEERQPSNDMITRYKPQGGNAFDRWRYDLDLHPRQERIVIDDTMTPEWPELSCLLHALTMTCKDLISSQNGNNVYAKEGYIYEMYLRMHNNDVWHLKVENRSRKHRYTNTGE
jgi:hypothetical protein